MKKPSFCRRHWILLIVVVLLISGLLSSVIYVSDYYHASDEAISILEDPTDSVKIIQDQNRVAFIPGHPTAGMIFYPGGKVQFEAYAPLLEKIAERGVLCVMPHMPANLAVLDQNAADGIRDTYPQITKWYMGGHSLGGTIAASYLADHTEDYQGLILLASYCTEDLSTASLQALLIYGSEDGVLNMEKYAECKQNLPQDTTEVVIDGGCHAYFGSYGEQEGDGALLISREDQIRQTAEAIDQMVNH